MEKRKKLNFNLYNDNVYCSYGTAEGGPLLSDDIANTIKTHANTNKLKTKLEIEFSTSKDSNIDKDEFLQAYNNTFSSKKVEKKHELSRCILTGSILMAIGIILLVIYVSMVNRVPYFWFELFCLLAWVFCWGGIEVLTIELVQIVIEIKKIDRLINSNIAFKTKDSTQKNADNNKNSNAQEEKQKKLNNLLISAFSPTDTLN